MTLRMTWKRDGSVSKVDMAHACHTLLPFYPKSSIKSLEVRLERGEILETKFRTFERDSFE